jgi:hypothetical protein
LSDLVHCCDAASTNQHLTGSLSLRTSWTCMMWTLGFEIIFSANSVLLNWISHSDGLMLLRVLSVNAHLTFLS